MRNSYLGGSNEIRGLYERQRGAANENADQRSREMITTLNEIIKHKPCKDRWERLLRSLNKTQADDEPLKIAKIINTNGFDDALWCLRAVEGHDREIRLFAVWCARQVQHLMTDQCSIDALEVAERHANREASDDELFSAWAASWVAAGGAVTNTAHDAARAAARTNAGVAARGAARISALDDTDVLAAQDKELRRICNEVAR